MKFITHYKEIKKEKPILRNSLRNLALNGLSNFMYQGNKKVLHKKPRVQFLYIHHIFRDEEDKFDQLLRRLSLDYIFISHTEAVDRILANNIDRPYISISSDDGFKNNLRAAKIMEKHGVTGCFFINPDTIGQRDFAATSHFCRSKLDLPPVEFMDWKDVDLLMREGHEIGSHSMNHINIAKTEISSVEDNLYKSYEEIKSKCGEVKHFAYPYGQFYHFNYDAFKIVFDVGYASCASAERGCHVTSQPIEKHDLLIRRDQIVLDWNKRHIYYFLLKSSANANPQNNYNPYE